MRAAQVTMKSAQRRRKHCALAVVRRTHKQTHKQTGAITVTAQLSAQCNKQNVTKSNTRPELSGKLRTNRTVFSCLLNVGSDGEVTSAGRVFHTRAAATGKMRSPTVDRRVEGTTSADVDDERRRRRESRSATYWRRLARYDGARPLRQR